MKTDKYKNWESKFFDGEVLTPEEEKLLIEQSDNPYFSVLKDERKQGFDLSFDEFLKKAESEEPKVIPIEVAKPTFASGFKNYWMAASLVMFMGVLGGYLFVNEETGEFNKPLQSVVKQDTEPVMTESSSREEPDASQAQDDVLVVKEPSSDNLNQNKEETTVGIKSNNQDNRTSRSEKHNEKIHLTSKPELAYNPNYVVINGKPVYNEQEAIALTEDAVNYLASNVSKTVGQAQSATSLSLELNK